MKAQSRSQGALKRMGLGAAIGVLAFLALAAVLYLTPLRIPFLSHAGREFPLLKRSLQLQYDALQAREQQIAAATGAVPEALKATQEKAWRDYAEQRVHLVEKIRVQSGLSLPGFLAWVADVWIWVLLLGVASPALGAWVGRMRTPAAPAAPATLDPLAQLKEATRRISEITTTTVLPVVAAPSAKPVEYLEVGATLFQPEAFASEEKEKGPEVWSPNALVMEDESLPPTGTIESLAVETTDPEMNGENPYGKMPETTEFEQLERQREEVLRCARKGMTSSEIARRLRIGQDQVDLIIRMRRERGA